MYFTGEALYLYQVKFFFVVVVVAFPIYNKKFLLRLDQGYILWLESPLDCKEIQPVHSEGDQPWDFLRRNDVKAETTVLWPPHANSWLIGKALWCWEGLGAGGEGDDRGWDGWMASLTQWTWVWVNSGSWWWTGRPGVLRFMGSQGVRHDWVTELNWTEPHNIHCCIISTKSVIKSN